MIVLAAIKKYFYCPTSNSCYSCPMCGDFILFVIGKMPFIFSFRSELVFRNKSIHLCFGHFNSNIRTCPWRSSVCRKNQFEICSTKSRKIDHFRTRHWKGNLKHCGNTSFINCTRYLGDPNKKHIWIADMICK